MHNTTGLVFLPILCEYSTCFDVVAIVDSSCGLVALISFLHDIALSLSSINLAMLYFCCDELGRCNEIMFHLCENGGLSKLHN